MLRNFRALVSHRYLSAISRGCQGRGMKTAASGSDIVDAWKARLEELNVPDVKSSLDNILAHVLNQKQVGSMNLFLLGI